MSIAERSALYQERTGSVTTEDQIDRFLDELTAARSRVRETPLSERRALAQACLDGMLRHRREWVEAGCRAKGISLDSPMAAEELGAGPMATVRYLKLLVNSLKDIEEQGVPRLPGEPKTGPDGHLRVPVLPCKGMFDQIAFGGFKAHVWMEPGVTRENLQQNMAKYYREGQRDEGVCLVLGAGNVSSIAPTDAFSKIFHEGKVVLLKMNPVNEYLGPLFEKSFRPLIDAGFLRIVYGGADVGSYAVNHPLVEEAHITGSIFSHDTIVWGPPGPEREERKARRQPLINKVFTSELGNVSPWIIVPGDYTDAQLRFQAENVASSVVNNCSFNCVATKMLITWKGWKDRQRFLDMIDEVLSRVPRRKAYYPGAMERFRRFTNREPDSTDGSLPWTLIRDVSPERDPIYFDEESFVCVFAETALEATDSADFLSKATTFANERLWGTLACSLTVAPSFRKDPNNEALLDRCVAELRFGTIGINYWSALSYALMCTPWGGYPGGTLENPLSGIGWVHNTYMFDKPLKSVIEGPITLFPKPLWFPTNGRATAVIDKVLDLYEKPSIFRIPGLLLAAIKG